MKECKQKCPGQFWENFLNRKLAYAICHALFCPVLPAGWNIVLMAGATATVLVHEVNLGKTFIPS